MSDRPKKPGKIRAEIKKINSMPAKESFQYIWYYYKGIILTIIGIAVALLLLYWPSKTNTEQYQCYINDFCYIEHVDYLDNFIKYLDLDEESNHIDYNSYYTFDIVRSASLLISVNSGTVDSVLCTEQVFTESIIKMAVFDDLETWLPEDLLEELGDKIYYDYASEGATEKTALAIDVSEFLGYKSSDGTFNSMFLCFPNTSLRQENSIAFIRYIIQKEEPAPGYEANAE